MDILLRIIDIAYYLLVVLIFIRILFSYVKFGSYEIRNLVFRLTEPILAPVRRVLPAMSGLDFSPLIVLLAAGLLRRFLYQLIL